jgi:hypothetical protein
MANTDSTLKTPSQGFRLRPATIVGLLALLAPVSYLSGRLSTEFLADTFMQYIASGVAAGALGVMVGIPIGLFFGTQRTGAVSGSAMVSSPNTRKMELSILEQLRDELSENKALFDARKGSTSMYARIDYITPFWTSIKASGRLFVMQDATLLSTIGTAYYWLDQATHLETLAYEAKYARPADKVTGTAEHLIGEARLLDGQIETTLAAAIAALNEAIAAQPRP